MDVPPTDGGSALTGTQYLLWMGQKLNPDIPLYNMILTFRLKARIDASIFAQAWDHLVQTNDALRSVILEQEGQPEQRVLNKVPEPLQFVDLSARPGDLGGWLDAQKARLFNLDECLYHSALVCLGEDEYLWYLNQHHLYTDGWSSSVVYRRLLECYEELVAGTLTTPEPYPAYQDYVKFEREADARTAQRYWDEKLARFNAPPVSLYGQLASDLSPSTVRVTRMLGPDLTSKLKELSSRKGILTLTPDLALFQIFATALFAWSHRASGSHKLAIGAPSHNRPSKSFKETIGVFIEIFPLLAELDEGETFLSLFKKVLAETGQFFRHAQPGAGKPEYNRAFPVFLNFIHASFPDFEEAPVEVDWIHSGYGDRDHALRLQVHDFSRSGELCLHFDLNDDLFAGEMKAWAPEHFVKLLEHFAADPEAKITDVPLLGTEESEAILHEYNATGSVGPEAKVSVIERLHKQAKAFPDRVALRQGGETSTYGELLAAVDLLASNLKARGIGRGDKVALCLRRSREAVITLLGILRAGAAYVPLDPAYPAERLRFILEDIDAPLLITDTQLRGRLPETNTPIILTEEALEASPEQTDLANPALEDIAYLIYTSGSTGKPKGVLVDHAGLSQYATWSCDTYLDGEPLAFPLFSSLAFDLTVTSIFVPLISGGEIVIYPEGDDAVDLAILQVIEEDAVDIVKLTPSHLALFRDLAPQERRLRKMILGGEDLRADLAKTITAAFTDLEIYNEYGPTEAVVGCMIHKFSPDLDGTGSVPIGKPASGVQIYLLDSHLQPVASGVPGEMYIGGDRLARGYWNRPDLTKERFVRIPKISDGLLYRTGDLARLRDPQTLVYLGRLDDQVKVRGVRIELGEIETQMAAHPAVSEAAVDLIQFDDPAAGQEHLFHCVSCGLPSNFPEVDYDDDGVCHLCQEYATYEQHVAQYFGNLTEFEATLRKASTRKGGEYDCIALLSGGKDSTYVVYQLVRMGFKVLAFTLDNGYISDGAKANIRKVVEELGIDHVFGETPAMNAIFVDSLKRFSNVCQGCFKALYTLSMQLALDKGIPTIVTGLSRGQFFETRLTAESFCQPQFDASKIDDTVLEARKAYHRMDDVVARTMETEAFQDDEVFEQVEFVDFYRYSQVSLEDMYTFLENDAPWIRPDDTGRSTNCLINEVGIYVHKKERGHHNYALPYSWDVRLGHKERDAAMDELDDQIDVQNVHRILKEIGYESDLLGQEHGDKRIAGYYVSEQKLTTEDWQSYLANQLPDYLIPSYFVQLPKLPLTVNGKVDRALLPPPVERGRPELHQVYMAPESTLEAALADIWADVLKVERVGMDDNFFDLGGDSIMNIQIVARCAQAGIELTASQLFKNQTVRQLAQVARFKIADDTVALPEVTVAPLTAIQQWFFRHAEPAKHWNHELTLQVAAPLDGEKLKAAVSTLVKRHPALRTSFTETEQKLLPEQGEVDLTRVQVKSPDSLSEACAPYHQALDVARGHLLHVVWASFEDGHPDCLVFIAHHLAVDGVSWQILIKDLESAYQGDLSDAPSTASYLQWASHLHQADFDHELPFWKDLVTKLSGQLAVASTQERFSAIEQHQDRLDAEATDTLLNKTPQAYHTQIQDALLAALVLSLSEVFGHENWLIDVEGHGRQHPLDKAPAIHGTVGWFTSIYPVYLEAGNGDAIEALKTVKDALRSLPNQGFAFGSLREKHEDLRQCQPRQILFNYLGQLDGALSTSTFRYHKPLALRRDPELVAPYLLEVNAFTDHGELHLSVDHPPGHVSLESMAALSRGFMDKLKEINARCASGDKPTAPADFPLANLDSDQLGKISALLKKPKTDR